MQEDGAGARGLQGIRITSMFSPTLSGAEKYLTSKSRLKRSETGMGPVYSNDKL